MAGAKSSFPPQFPPRPDPTEDSLDVFAAVEHFHHLDFHKIVPRNFRTLSKWVHIPRCNDVPAKVSAVRLLKALPLHIMACLLAKQPANPVWEGLTSTTLTATSYFSHVCRALDLMCTLSAMIDANPSLNDCLMGPDPAFTAQVVDMTNLSLLAIAGPEAASILKGVTRPSDFSLVLDKAGMVRRALLALALTTSAQLPPLTSRTKAPPPLHWPGIAEALFNHPRGTAIFDAGFEAVRVLVCAVREALIGPMNGDKVEELAYSAGGAMELLAMLASTPLFYHRLMLHDPHGEAPLRLILSCLTLHDSPLAVPPFAREDLAAADGQPTLAPTQPPYSTDKGKGSAELLAARGFALLLQLCEFSNPSFLDEVSSSSHSRAMTERLVHSTAAYIGPVLLRPPVKMCAPAVGEGQLSNNVLRVAELLADDSNYRAWLIQGLAGTIAQLLLTFNAESFKSMWCVGEEAVVLMAKDDILINSCTKQALEGVHSLITASREYHMHSLGVGKVPGLDANELRRGRQQALERAVLLAKLLVNLHFWVEGMDVSLKDAFVNRLVGVLRMSPASAEGVRTATANLECLFEVAWRFGGPNALRRVELMAPVDMEQSQDLLAKMKARIAEDAVPRGQQVTVYNRPRPTMGFTGK